MMVVKSDNYYPSSIRVIHWLSAILLTAVVFIVLLRDQLEGKLLRLQLLNLHRGIGLTILALVLLRIFFKVKHLNNVPDHGLSLITKIAANLVHMVIYGCLIILPVLGLLQTNASGKDASFFGLFPLPHIIAYNEDIADMLQDYHEYIAWGLVALVAVHLLAALWHHFILKDSVLESMKIKFQK